MAGLPKRSTVFELVLSTPRSRPPSPPTCAAAPAAGGGGGVPGGTSAALEVLTGQLGVQPEEEAAAVRPLRPPQHRPYPHPHPNPTPTPLTPRP